MNEISFPKKIKNLIGVISVGILTSCLWELLIKDLLFFIGNFFVDSASFFYKDYTNTIYNKVGNGEYSILTIPSIMIIIFIIFLPVFATISLKFRLSKYETKNQKLESSTKDSTFFLKLFSYLLEKRWRLYLFVILLSLPNSIIYTDELIQSHSSISAYRLINKDIEIIKPYISSRDYDLLRSELFQVNNKEKVLQIIKKINFIAEKNNISLENRRLLGIGYTNLIK